MCVLEELDIQNTKGKREWNWEANKLCILMKIVNDILLRKQQNEATKQKQKHTKLATSYDYISK